MLSVPEEFLLLTAGDGGQSADAPLIQLPGNRPGIRFAMAGACLMELSLRDRIETDVERLWVRNAEPVGEPLLDPVLATVDELCRHGEGNCDIVSAIKALDGIDFHRVALASLRARGVVREDVQRILWVLPVKTDVVAGVDVMLQIRNRIHEVLLGDAIPEPRDACLISLLDATRKFRLVVPDDKVQHAIAQTRRYSSLDLVGRNVALHVGGMIESLSKYGDIV